jgi:hypothetical protein
MKHSLHWPALVGVLAALFGAGIGLGLGYRWFEGSMIPDQLLVTAAGNTAPSEIQASAPQVPAPSNLPAGKVLLPSPQATPAAVSNQSPVEPLRPAEQSNSNVVVLSRIAPSPSPSNEMTLPQLQRGNSADRLAVIGSQGQTIWVPRAIEGCWAGSGGGSVQYLGGCPNLFSGSSIPIRLRWCFRRVGNQPLTLTTAKGQYPGRVSQRWDVIGASSQTLELREKISYKTMAFLHVVDVGDWTCRITRDNELVCDEHELARCGPGKWMQGPWFRGSGSVIARRAGGGNLGGRFAAEP